MHGVTYKKIRVVTHVRGCESLACKVGELIAELVMMRYDEAVLLKVEGVSYGE